MAKKIARQFLINYKKISDPILKLYLQEKTKQASLVGKIPEETVKRFTKLALKGKRIRGALVMLGYQLADGKNKKSIAEASLSIELYHAGLLVHDDIMDNASTRRGLPALHKQFFHLSQNNHLGRSLAICMGDQAFYLAWEKLLNSSFPKERILKASKIFTKYAIRLANGQALDVTINQEKKVSEKDILKLMYLKSGEYTCELPLLLGVELAGGMEAKRLTALLKYAKALGWAFQIQDDILGIFGNENITGKPNTSDLKEGKMTLLMLHLIKHGTKKQKAFQKKVLGNQNITEKDIIKMRNILKKSGSNQYVMNLGQKYIKSGKKQIPNITKNKKLSLLLSDLLDFMIERTK